MAQYNTSGQARISEKIIFAIKKAGDLPANYQVTTLNTYLGDAVDDTTYLKVLTGFSLAPAPVNSDNDTEGNSAVLAVDVPGTAQILQLTPEDFANLNTNFGNIKCDIVMIYGDPDRVVTDNGDGTFTLAVVAGDRIAIQQKVTPYFSENHADATDFKATMTWNKQIAANDTVTTFATVVVDP